MDTSAWRKSLLLRLAINVIRKDWFEHKKLILFITGGMFLPMISGVQTDLGRGMVAGILMGASYSYGHFCFYAERQRGTLQLLLSLPVRPMDLALAKYASLYSMALFTANVPGVFLRDLRLLFILNAFVVFLATASMAGTVISEKPWASMIPFWFVLIFVMPIQNVLKKYYPNGVGVYAFLGAHIVTIAAIAVILAVVLAYVSSLYFKSRCAQ
jgi:hypothetical protein